MGYSPKPRSFRAFVYRNQLVEHRQRLFTRTLECVAANDRAIATAIANVTGILIDGVRSLGCAARKYDEPTAIEATFNDMGDALGLG